MGKSIGNTPLIELKNIEKDGGRYENTPAFRLFAKVEGENLGGSIKDRVAQAILDDAEEKGTLKKGGAVIEATSGNTGIGLALCCRLRGYQAKIVMPDTMSVERQEMIKAQGGEVLLTDGKKGMSGAVEKALEILKNTPNAILADQFNNPVCWTAHYESTGPEIWAQTKGEIDVFVACVGTGGTLTGVGKYLKEKNPNIRVIAVEPSASPLLSQGYAGAHGIQGIGANFVPKVLDRRVYDDVMTVTDEEAFAMARRIKKEENLSVGISSGAAVAAALKLGKRPENAGKTIVTILPDNGDRYESIL
ncbi:MAG: cysteine synthase A [Clostridia bacterium]|nr:cysteine synthase A [Clostridia bacterium]